MQEYVVCVDIYLHPMFRFIKGVRVREKGNMKFVFRQYVHVKKINCTHAFGAGLSEFFTFGGKLFAGFTDPLDFGGLVTAP